MGSVMVSLEIILVHSGPVWRGGGELYLPISMVVNSHIVQMLLIKWHWDVYMNEVGSWDWLLYWLKLVAGVLTPLGWTFHLGYFRNTPHSQHA